MVKRLTGGALAVALAAAATYVAWSPASNACGYRPMGSACDGWSAGRPKSATVAYLYMHDPEFADWLLAHNEHGREKCQWRPAR